MTTQTATQSSNPASNTQDYWDRELNHADKPKEQKNEQESLYMRLPVRPEPYKFRLVSKPLVYRQHWQAFKTLKRADGKFVGPVISPAVEKSEMDLDAAWRDGGYMPDKKFAVLVIDRDSGNLRLLQTGPGVFGTIIDHNKLTKIDPWADGAPDWYVKVEKVMVKQKDGKLKEKTEYSVAAVGSNSLTDAERKKLDAFNAKVDWHKWFVRATPEQIQALYDQLPDDLKVSKWAKDNIASKAARASSQPQKPSEPAKAPTEPVKAPVQQPVQAQAPAPSPAPAPAPVAEAPEAPTWIQGAEDSATEGEENPAF
jgi:hypothetical protein